MKAFALVLMLGVAPVASAGDRVLVDEIVAVVDTHSITLSELSAETRVKLAFDHGADAAAMKPDRALLAAALRKSVDERVVLAEAERLKLFDLDRAEVDAQLAHLRAQFRTLAEYEAFIRSVELTEEEVGTILGRELRVARYLDNRLKLAAQLRESEVDDAAKGRKLTATERDTLRSRLASEKYQRLLLDLLGELRRRSTVRVLDSLEAPKATAEAGEAP